MSGLPTRTNIPLASDDMAKVLMEGNLNGGVGDTGALWQQLSLANISDVTVSGTDATITKNLTTTGITCTDLSVTGSASISTSSGTVTTNGFVSTSNIVLQSSGVDKIILQSSGDVDCNDIHCSDITCSDIVYDTLNTSSIKTRTKEYSFDLPYTNSWATFATISRNFNTNNWRSCMVEFCVAYSTSNGGGSGGGSYAGNFRYNFASGTRSVAVFGLSTLYNNGGYVAFQFSALNTSGQAGGVQVQMRNYRGITQSVVVSMKITSLDYFDMT